MTDELLAEVRDLFGFGFTETPEYVAEALGIDVDGADLREGGGLVPWIVLVDQNVTSLIDPIGPDSRRTYHAGRHR